ncbi:DUF2182 domain-containing protein [Stappia sp. F7233]|uniref:DUF2182 domain-containing protein n=1 Tax=Stappia albiluteola TaxID=2758565 RepID=A0A839ACB2_9HYPH|nr:DUF2182 domain-containing protein [Stappia albiluteola]MBA5776624.1 DUF2182 domain-containing protein [Stappia albiluteola]
MAEQPEPGGRTLTERILLRDQMVTVTGLVLITGLSWWWLLMGAGTGMSVTAMTTWSFPPPERPSMVTDWTLAYAVTMVVMWWVMMIAMMTPSAAPMVLLYGTAHRHEAGRGKLETAAAPTFAFFCGYLAAWLVFSVVATGLQWALELAGLVHAMLMWSIDRQFSGAFLIMAGAYQFSPFKQACLRHCRAPAVFLARHYRRGTAGAFRMGLTHGLYCLGCCLLLMALLFVGGIMNLVWIAGLAILVLLEKLLPRGEAISRLAGVVFLVSGLWLMLA